MQYTNIYDLKNPGSTVSPLKKKVAVAVAKSAQSILLEAPGAFPNEAGRKAWAKNALINAEQMAEAMMWAVLGNGDVQTGGDTTTDVTVQYVVDVSVDTFAS